MENKTKEEYKTIEKLWGRCKTKNCNIIKHKNRKCTICNGEETKEL